MIRNWMTKIINILNLRSFLAQSIARLTEEKNVAKFITVIVFVCNSPTPYDHLNVLFLRHFRLNHIYFPLKCKDFHSTWPVSRIFRWRKLAVRVYFFWSLVRVACRLVRFPSQIWTHQSHSSISFTWWHKNVFQHALRQNKKSSHGKKGYFTTARNIHRNMF